MPSRSGSCPTLLLASLSLPSARQLAEAAAGRGWRACALDETPDVDVTGERAFYGGSDRAAEYAKRFDLCLVEPPLELLARVPAELLCRGVRFGTLSALARVEGPVFVKPADPILRSFDAGVYRRVADVHGRGPIDGGTPVLVAEAVEWTAAGQWSSSTRRGAPASWGRTSRPC